MIIPGVEEKSKGEIVEQVSLLRPSDHVLLNTERWAQLKQQLGETDARDVMRRAIAELVLRLDQVDNCHGRSAWQEMKKSTRLLLAISDQIGLDTLTMVADDVLTCLETGDSVALAATHNRLMRSGKASLSELWEMQGPPA